MYQTGKPYNRHEPKRHHRRSSSQNQQSKCSFDHWPDLPLHARINILVEFVHSWDCLLIFSRCRNSAISYDANQAMRFWCHIRNPCRQLQASARFAMHVRVFIQRHEYSNVTYALVRIAADNVMSGHKQAPFSQLAFSRHSPLSNFTIESRGSAVGNDMPHIY